MGYRYNAERDRLDRYAYNPAFFKATYIGRQTEREMMLWASTSNRRHEQTVAERFMKPDEEIENISLVTKENFLNWLLNGEKEIVIYGQAIPAEYVMKFLIAEDQPSADPEKNNGKYGDLDKFKAALLKQDREMLQKLHGSYMLSRPEADIVREAEEVPPDHPGWAKYKEESARLDREETVKKVASMERPNVPPLPEMKPNCSSDEYEFENF